MALENNLVVDSDAELKAFLSSILSSEGIVVNINRTFIAYNNGTNRNRVFARCANRMAQKGTDEKFVVIALMCYPALNWILKARDIDAMIEQLHDMDTDGSVRNISEIQSLLENSTGYVKPRLHLEMMPIDSTDSDDSINEELFKDLPTATDISMDPVTAYEAITGVSKADATETECMTELFRKQMKLCSEACGQGFRYVESPLVRAIRNGWVCELQEPSLITRPSVMPGLNGLLDETGCVVLPTGEMLHRHPDCIIISTLNVDLEGCRPLNQSFIDRHHLIVDMKCPNDAVIIKRIKGMTGCGNDVPLQTMVDCVHQIAKKCQTCGATDGNVNSMRSLANWVQAGMLIGDYAKAAEWTVVSGATSDPQTREELMGVVANYSFA